MLGTGNLYAVRQYPFSLSKNNIYMVEYAIIDM